MYLPIASFSLAPSSLKVAMKSASLTFKFAPQAFTLNWSWMAGSDSVAKLKAETNLFLSSLRPS